MMGKCDYTQNLSTFVANADASAAILSEIGNNSGANIPQPVMVIGTDGSGKTSLLKRVFDSIANKNCVWIDGRTLFATDDILRQFPKDSDSIIFIDDMDYYLSRCSYEEQFNLRRSLNNEGAPMLVASASKLMPSLTEYAAPFFEGLKLLYLSPISKEQLAGIFGGKELDRALAIYGLLPPTIKSLGIIDGIIKLHANTVDDINSLITIFSEKYKNTYSSLPINCQSILNALGQCEQAATIPEIRSINGMPTNLLSVYLKRLRDLDIVAADKSAVRATKYALRDPLFKLWLKPHREVCCRLGN